ncbi:PAS domain S-box protein [uncultured Methanoregula sp.]|uniref:PAS domain S-box protein n=1 Tax=uncultured Methanoregula sp. TaxID=1005933 RepID=UPI002AABE324|nr:PAS domain S-box protein [uncultured Methanoregula sp.]
MISFVFDLIIGMLFISGISMACVALYARRFVGRVPAATPYVILLFAAAAWAILYALDLLTATLPLKIVFHNLRFLFLPFFPVLELWLVIAYVKKTEWLRRDWALLVLTIPVISAVLAITSPYHDLFRYNFSINTAGPVPILQYSESAFYTVYFVYSLILLVLAVVLLVYETRRRGTLRETQTVLLILALALPTVINYTSAEGLTPVPGLNMAPVLLWIPAILYTVALFRYQFLDIVPIARSRLIEALSKPVMVLDPDGRVIDMNPAACSLFSTRYSSAIGRPVEEISPDWPDLLLLCRESKARKRELIRITEGATHYYIGSGEPLLTGHGEIEGHLIFLQDITDLKNTEAALRQKTEELDQYFSTSLDLFCIADTNGYFRRLNPQWEKALGYTTADLEGRRFLDFVHPDDLPATLAAIADLSSQKEVVNFTNRYRHRDGMYRWIEWRSFPKGVLIFAAARDITERKRMEEALRESEEKYRSIIEEMQDLFYRTDLAGKITMLSPSAAKIAGYDSIDQLIGQDVTTVYADPADRDRLLLALREKGSVDAFPLNLKTRNGTIRHVTTSSHFFHDAGGNIRGVEGVIHDITEQRKAEDALRMANRKLNLLSSITRHDIRNQLMALMAFLELSVESVDNPAELADFLKKNQKIAETIARQITFTKEYEDLGVKAPSWQDIRVLIGKAVDGLPVKNVRVGVETKGLEIFADPLMEKVFYNLIDNSLRYGGEGLTAIRITSHEEGTSQVLVFEDDGIGIAHRDKNVLFDKGFGKNTGLGLYLSREILSITGITIAENGEPGNGVQFEITVPKEGYRRTP